MFQTTIQITVVALKLQTFNIFQPPHGPMGSCDPRFEVKHEGLGTQTCLPWRGDMFGIGIRIGIIRSSLK